ncbi:hypothetical protein TNCV_1661941 [Trichonephila clavipes]|nr:hypothetical protein TNCV_1661941 [Trichonephila clavipes]
MIEGLPKFFREFRQRVKFSIAEIFSRGKPFLSQGLKSLKDRNIFNLVPKSDCWRYQRNKYNSEISKKPTLRQKNPDRVAALSYLSPFQLTSPFNSLCMRDLQECCLIWLLGSICIS